ncbi:MAG: 3-phosphoshikimate 1-carboxyvinyltransferase [Legionella sp.]
MSSPYLISRRAKPLCGECMVPGDKSISHRALIFASIAIGTSSIHGFLEADDCIATRSALKTMGVSMTHLNSQSLIIHGVGKYGLRRPSSVINCGNSATSLRLLTGLLVAQPFSSTLTGDESLQKRPMSRISVPLNLMGAKVATSNGHSPLSIDGNPQLAGIRYEMPIASAQVKSCLLLAGIYAAGKTQIIEKSVTRDHTERMLKTFSYPYEKSGHMISIDANHECMAADLTIPGDISSATFLIVAATLVPGSRIWIKNVGINPTRTGAINLLKMMGATIIISNERYYGEEPVGDIYVEYQLLHGIVIPEDMVPIAIDEFPIILIAAACAQGETLLQGAGELRSKETDRIVAMVSGLQALGINAQELKDGVLIEGGSIQGGTITSHQDHRVAMAFAIAGAVAQQPITILDSKNITTSFPNFVAIANKINMVIEEYNDDTQ